MLVEVGISNDAHYFDRGSAPSSRGKATPTGLTICRPKPGTTASSGTDHHPDLVHPGHLLHVGLLSAHV
jgi:hypothetical protein